MTTRAKRNPPAGPTGVTILGSTGSIGRQTLEVIDQHPDRFRVVALAAGSNVELLASQAAHYRPDLVALAVPPARRPDALPRTLATGADGLRAAATHPDAAIVVVATTGHAAILPTVAALDAGKTIALANKETIVCAGELILPRARANANPIRPVDSEHSAIWQCLGQASAKEVERLILTASGGPFLETPVADLAAVSREQALAHPTWSMGGKVTVDSATLMNKGLEVIEAHWLFSVPYEQIDIVIHPESIVHSLVEFVDGGQIAQLSVPDMRLPIQYALTYPERVPSAGERLDLAVQGSLRFIRPDERRFPALSLARQAGMAGKTFPTVLSATDEVAVAAFLSGHIRFIDIVEIVDRVLADHSPEASLSLDAITRADAWARAQAQAVIATIRATH